MELGDFASYDVFLLFFFSFPALSLFSSVSTVRCSENISLRTFTSNLQNVMERRLLT